MTRYRQLPVICACGLPIATYLKGGSGRLRKMYFGRILTDPQALFNNEPPQALGTDIHCPECQKRLGTVMMIHGHAAVKINQGVIRT